MELVLHEDLRIGPVVDVSRDPTLPERCPVHLPAQVGPLVLSEGGDRVALLRWVPGPADRWDPGSETLHLTLSARAAPLVADPLAASRGAVVPVLALVGPLLYELGTFRLGEGAGGARLELVREAPPPAAVAASPPPPDPEWLRRLRAWGLPVTTGRVLYQVGAGDAEWCHPDACLHDALADVALRWCGPDNRHGRTCQLLAVDGGAHPTPRTFRLARLLAQRFHQPVLLACAGPWTPAGVLLRPGDGASCRAHFDVEGAGPRVRLVLGELGEYGPLHPLVGAAYAGGEG